MNNPAYPYVISAIIVAPVSMLILLITWFALESSGLTGDGLLFTVFIIMIIGSIITFLIALAAGAIIFGLVSCIIAYKKSNQHPKFILTQYTPYLAGIFALGSSTFVVTSGPSDPLCIGIGISSFYSALLGWGIFVKHRYKINIKTFSTYPS